MARTTYGKPFRTRKGRYGRYKYVNGRRVSFVSSKRRRNKYSYRPDRRFSKSDARARANYNRR